MASDIKLRLAMPKDYASLGAVMFDAVRRGHSEYSEVQREAWVPKPREGQEWNERLDQQKIIVAENADGIIGFMSLAPHSYLDFAYIRPKFQGQGLFRKLYAEIEVLATLQKQPRIWVHASLMAQPAFSKIGFNITKEETVTIADQAFKRFKMEKLLEG